MAFMDFVNVLSGRFLKNDGKEVNIAAIQENGMGGVSCRKVNSSTAVTITAPEGQFITAITCCGEVVISAATAAPGYSIEGLPDTYPTGIELTLRLSALTVSGFCLIYIGN